MTDTAREDRLILEGRTIAHLLPGAWRFIASESWLNKVEQYRERLVIRNDDDRTQEIHLQDDWKDADRWRVWGNHMSRDGGIGCAKSRGPEAIARDIERRFLPDYLKAHGEWRVNDKARGAAQAAYEIKRDLVLRTIPGARECSHTFRPVGGEKRIYFKGGSMKTYVGYRDDKWSMTLDVSFEDAMRVLCMLKKEKEA